MGSIHSGYGNKTRRGSYITGRIKITNPYFVWRTIIRKLSLHGVRKLSGGRNFQGRRDLYGVRKLIGGWDIHYKRNIRGERNFHGVRIPKTYKSKMTFILCVKITVELYMNSE